MIAFYPGAFKPPHIGHFIILKTLLDDKNIDKIYLIISEKSRDHISINDSLNIWKIYFKYLPNNNKIEIIKSKISPILMINNLLKKYKNEKILLIKSNKNAENKRFEIFKNDNIKEYIIKQYGNIHASDMRKLKNKKELSKYVPKELKDKEIEKIWKIIYKK